MTRFRAWAHKHPFTVSFLTMAIVVAVTFWRSQVVSDRGSSNNAARIAQIKADSARHDRREHAIVAGLRGDLTCVETWITASFERSQAITSPANSRINDLFAAFDQAIVHHHQHRALYLARRAIRENNQYHRELRKHPLPVPKIRCRLRIPIPTRHPTPHPRPPNGPTATVTAPGPTRTVFVPGPTRTVFEPPGKGGAATVTRTKTVTATPAPTCLATLPGVCVPMP